MTDLEYSETSLPRDVQVTQSEVRALRRARHGLSLEELADDRVRLGPRIGYVGSVQLPTGRRVVVSPKAAVSSIPELLSLAYRTMAPPAVAGSTAVEDATPADWLLLQLAGEVNALLSRGLRRGYVEARETLPFVRGRVRPPLNPARLPLLDCHYADFTADTLENRLLRGVLELFAPAARNRHVRKQIADATNAFAEVQPTRPSSASFDGVTLTRLNKHYEPSLRLARLALEGAGVVDAAGVQTAPAYFVPMPKVWETAVAAALRDAGLAPLEQPQFSDRFVQQRGEPNVRVAFKPDLLIGRRLDPKMVIDLKWAPAMRLHHGRKRLQNEHLYQLATYCTALGCDGLLLYPLMDDEVNSTYEFNGRKLSLRTIDLGQPGLAELRSFSDQLAQSLAG